uniref:Mitochondrial carrier 2 n=1 Tax=Lygus hesperus TaxID=30085 RepID=A0A146LKV5_LYGHE
MTDVQAPTMPLSTYGLRLLAVNIIGHPLDYVRFLIQIGHEPLPPYPAKTIFGKSIMRLPSILKYVEYIKSRDGWLGLYRGLVPKVLGHVLGSGAAITTTDHLKLKGGRNCMDDPSFTEKQRFVGSLFQCQASYINNSCLPSMYDEWQSMMNELNFQDVASEISWLKFEFLILTLQKSVVERVVFISVSHPFITISARMMASFVGGEEAYSGMFSAVRQIFKEDGLVGFFSGYLPRLIGDIAAVVISTVVVYSINNYIVKEKDLQTLTGAAFGYYINSQAHPFAVVSSCMTVNNTSLQAGNPPNMLPFKSWISCWKHLKLNNQLQRGSALFFRAYNGEPAGSLQLLLD